MIMEEGISLGSSRNPPCNAWDVGLIPGWENKILHALEQLNSEATTGDPVGRNKDPTCCN